VTGKEEAMRRVIVRYRVKPDRADENEELVRAVYEELHETKPEGLRYATLRLDDGVSFVHLSESESDTSPLSEVPAFKVFQKEIADRADEQPVVTSVEVVGSYGFGYEVDQR
jgi:Antibiotic biosynthesis monooxygenase